MSHKTMLISASLSGFAAVLLGAFGAHALSEILTADLMEIYKTGVLYHLIHSVVLLALALSEKEFLRASFYFIFAGIALFSFSLYLYSLTEIKALVFVTPAGGICLALGWISIAFKAYRNSSGN